MPIRRTGAAPTEECTAVLSLIALPLPPQTVETDEAPGPRGGCTRAGALHRRGKPLGHCLDVLEELLPGLRGRLLVLLDPLDRVRDGGLDVALVGAEDLRLQLHRRGREDLPD